MAATAIIQAQISTLGFFLLLLLLVVAPSSTAKLKIGADYGIGALNRTSFPPRFLFGTASSSYQYEGAAAEDGKGPSLWDAYTHKYPEKIADGTNGDVAIDSYHRYKEDVRIMKEMGLDAYRFSISWPRILPHGKLRKGVNKKGLRYYHNLIDELLANGIQPFVTLFHWDTPQALEDAYGGFLSPHIVEDFRDYADLCFREYGGKVKHWITLNEPWSYAVGGYAVGLLAPGRCSTWQGLNCTAGDSATEPYLVGRNLLLSHAASVHLYRHKYQGSQKGKIGITIITYWMVPNSNAKHDQDAASRALDFMFMDPITVGEYPDDMKKLAGNRLPRFSKEESALVKGSYDFLGLNYYTANYASSYHGRQNAASNLSFITDAHVNLTTSRNGKLIGPVAASTWLHVYPRGIYDLLVYTKKKYNHPIIYITENGIDEVNNEKLSLEEALIDTHRIDYYHSHLAFLQLAIKHGVDVRGYFAWSLLDNFEWYAGYTVRFGINYVDYDNGTLTRHPKLSAAWFKNFLN
ncbi:hypothetical protein V2J09_006169 [Rumex salicifolius]